MTFDATDPEPELYRIAIPNDGCGGTESDPDCTFVLGQDPSGYVGLRAHVRSRGAAGYWSFLTRAKATNTETEFVLGQHESGFVGVFARVASGGIFLGAGGGIFGESSYQQFRDTLKGITLTLSGMSLFAGTARAVFFYDDQTGPELLLQGVKVGAELFQEGRAAALGAGQTSGGTVQIYGDSSVTTCAPYSVMSSTLGFASLSGAVTASVNSVVYANVSGTLASVTGTYKASISGYEAAVTANANVTIAARDGAVRLRGDAIELGTLGNPRGIVASAQVATRAVRVRADQEILMTVGDSVTDGFGTARMAVTDGIVRAETQAASVTLAEAATTLVCGASVMEMKPSGVTIRVAPGAPQLLVHPAVKAAETVYNAALLAAETASYAEDQLETAGLVALAGAAVGELAAAGDFLANRGRDSGAVAGVMAGAAAGGALVAGAAALAVKQVLAHKAKKLALAAVRAARRVANAVALEAEAGVLGVPEPLLPAIKVTATAIELSVGTNKFTIDATGIKVEGAMVEVTSIAPGKFNASTFNPG